MNISHVFDQSPNFGVPFPISDQVELLRIPIPDSLKFINCYLLETEVGCFIYDTGMATPEAKQIWRDLIQQNKHQFAGIIVSHHHPDHFGLAHWLSEKLSIPVYMDEKELVTFKQIFKDIQHQNPPEHFGSFFGQFGIDETTYNGYYKLLQGINMVHSGTPNKCLAIESCPLLEHGWRLKKGHGHSPNVCCLFNENTHLFLSSDQVLPQISSIVYVSWNQEQINPLKSWISSLEEFKGIPYSVKVLPSHKEVFVGLHTRIDEIIDIHAKRLSRVRSYLANHSRVNISHFTNYVFERDFTKFSDQFLASGEALAHLEYVLDEQGLALNEIQY